MTHFYLTYGQYPHWKYVWKLQGLNIYILGVLQPHNTPNFTYVFSCASAKAERSLSSLSCVWMYVDQNLGTPPPARISWICTKMLHHFCMTPNLPMTKKTPLPS